MRTTLNLDEDVLAMARCLAESHKISLGQAVSHLARRGANRRIPTKVKNGFVLFDVDPSEHKFGLEDIQAALDADDLEYAKYFRKPGD